MAKKGKRSWVNTPPTSEVTPPIETRQALLPFEQISWQDFERLCNRLVRLEANIEDSKIYGTQGDEQDGIDIFARTTTSEKYRVYQSKNEADFAPSKIKAAVDEFVAGEWLAKSDTFVLCTRESLRSAVRAAAVEEQVQVLKAKGVSFLTWDQEELSLRLKAQPEIVDDFFGRAWVRVFCGDEAADLLGTRLDAAEVKKLRSELFSIYSRVFNMHDKGIPLADALPLSDRFIVPDVEDKQSLLAQSSNESSVSEKPNEGGQDTKEDQKQKSSSATKHYSQRLPIENWISRSSKNLLFGDPGSGKSSFLRFLALDILNENPTMEFIAEKWGSYLPVWIPFALWTKIINQAQVGDSSVTAVVSSWLKSWGTESLIPLVEKALKDKRLLLLVDGLDEHSNNDAAKIALNQLEVFLALNDVSVVATTRPHGFEKLGMKTEGWQQSSIADLSIEQQKRLVAIWFEANSKKIHPTLDDASRLADIERQSSVFFVELGRSNELRELARNPLLLCLLISFQISNIKLPLGRFEAYEKLTEHLISTHPQARRVASQTTQTELAEADLKKALAHLANILHTQHIEGLIPEEEAQNALVEFLMDGERGLGMAKPQATENARNIIAKAEDTLGILVKKSPEEISFYHRTIQEYLVSFNISRLPLDDQIKIVVDNCTDPLWREVILGLLQITKRPDDVKRIVEAIQAKELSHLEEKIVDDLLSEIVFGNFNCPPNLARALSVDFFRKIELGTWIPHREKILRHALDGLRSSVMSELVKEKITSWFPDRAGWGTDRIFESMANWTMTDDLEVTLFKGLNAEDYRVKIASAVTLSKLAGGNTDIGNKLVDIVDYTDDQNILAAVVEALMIGWRDHASLSKLIERCAKSPLPLLSFIAIKSKVALKLHKESDLDKLLKFADRDSRQNVNLTELANTILIGWPKSDKVKKLCLDTLNHWGRRDAIIDREIALKILLEGYPMDSDVAKYCVQEIEREQFPFNTHGTDPFKVIAKNFRDHPEIVAALDVWINKQEHRDVEVSKAAIVGRTAIFKKHLIEDLNGPFPHWPAMALLEGWTMDDPEVSVALLALVNGPAKKASNFGYLFPKIVLNKEECKKRIKEVFSDPTCERYDFMIDGLVELGDLERDTEIVDIALAILERETDNNYTDGMKADLIRNYGFDPRVRELAMKTLMERDSYSYGAIAHSFGNDPEIRPIISSIATPLPVSLRMVIALYLSDAEIEDDFAISILSLYDHEVNEEIKVQSSIGYHTRLKNTEADVTQVIEILSKSIICYGPDYEQRRLAAFCGLTILGRLDIMETVTGRYRGEKPDISSIQGLHLNVPHIQFILENWDLIKTTFGHEFYSRIFGHSSGFYMWNHLADFADQYPTPRQEVLDFLSKDKPKIGQKESLLFLSRVQPQSQLLLEYCLGTLELNTPEIVERDVNKHPSHADGVIAAEIIGEQFAGNKDALDRINDPRNVRNPDRKIAVLSEGWPRSAELNALLDELAKTRRRCSEGTAMRYFSHRAGVIRMFMEIRRIIRSWSSNPKYHPNEAVCRPIIRRLQKDDSLLNNLMRYLKITDKPSEKVSIASIIHKARGLTPELKEWADQELIRQLSGNGSESGLDITTGEFVSVPYSIYGMLNA